MDLHRGGGLAVTAAGDKTVRLWDLRDPQELSRITAPEGVETTAAAFCGDGRTLAIAWQKRVLLFDVRELIAVDTK